MRFIKENVLQRIMKRTLVIRILTVSVFDLISKITSVFLFIFLIRILSKEDYAKFTFFNSVAFFVFGAIGVGISASYVRFESECISRPNSYKTNLYTFYILLVSLVYMIILILGAFLIVQPGKSLLSRFGDISIIAFAVLYSFPLSIQNINETYYQARENFKKAGFVFCLKNIFALSCILLLALFLRLNITYIVIIFIATSFIIATCYLIKIINKSKLIIIDFGEIKEIIRSSAWLILYCFFLSLFTQMDIFMVSSRLNEDMVANYGVAAKYYSLLLTLLPSIMTVLKVRTSKADMIDDPAKQKEYIISWIKGVSPVVTMIVAAISVGSYIFFPILNGSQYSASIPAFQILSVGVVISYIFAPNVSMLIAMRKERTLCIIGIIACAGNILGNYCLIPLYGINAAALVTVLSNAVVNVSSTIIVLYTANQNKQSIFHNSKSA